MSTAARIIPCAGVPGGVLSHMETAGPRVGMRVDFSPDVLAKALGIPVDGVEVSGSVRVSWSEPCRRFGTGRRAR